MCYSPTIIGVISSRRMSLELDVARMEERGGACKVFTDNPEGKNHLETRWENNTEIYFQEMS